MTTIYYMKDLFKKVKSEGLKETAKKYGKSALLVIFVFYLVRDSILYILLPYLMAYYW